MQNAYYKAAKDDKQKFLVAAKVAEHKVDEALLAEGYRPAYKEDRDEQQKLFS